MNEYINLTAENIENEHICCAISDKKHQCGVNNKKEWLKERIKEGHIFRKLNAQGKIFIEFAPLETAWTPVESKEKYLYIYCLWVAGSYKGKGYAKELLKYAIQVAKEKNRGLCTISSKKKKPFVSEKSFFEKFNFTVVDRIDDYELLALTFNKESPKFKDNVKKGCLENKTLTIFYSPQCPYTNNCIIEIEEFAKETNTQINIIKIDTLEKAKSIPCVFNNWATFKDGKFISNTLLNKNSLKKLLT